MKRIGFIVNPMAGIGGPAGMKGSDRKISIIQARRLNIEPPSPIRTQDVLERVREICTEPFALISAPGIMGAAIAQKAGIEPLVCGELCCEETGAEDTVRIAKQIVETGVDMLIFAGGDGTARDLCGAIGECVPVLGIPCGVKMHSAVFAVNPYAAAHLIKEFISGVDLPQKLQEVMDIDEQAYAEGRLSPSLYGFMRVPYVRKLIQCTKSGSSIAPDMLSGIAEDICERIEADADTYYLIGAGTTTMSVKRALNISGTLLGVDIIKGGKLYCADANVRQLMEITEEANAKIVVSPIGGQGFVFGRGNQQFSPALLERLGKENVIVICPSDKLSDLGGAPLLIDAGSDAANKILRGYIKVITDYHALTVYRVSDCT